MTYDPQDPSKVDYGQRLAGAVQGQLLAGRVIVVQHPNLEEWEFLSFSDGDGNWRHKDYLGRFTLYPAAAGIGMLELLCGPAGRISLVDNKFRMAVHQVMPDAFKWRSWLSLDPAYRIYNLPDPVKPEDES